MKTMIKLLTTAALSGVIALGALGVAQADEAAGSLGNENYPSRIEQRVDQPAVQEGRASTVQASDGWLARNGDAAIQEIDQQLSRD
jgi:hypothetical protein